jgi:branched-chain amino acid transport system substrate-binding protein
MMKRISLLSVFFLLPILFMLPVVTGAAETLKVGMVTSVTGPLSPAFKTMADAAKPTADLINETGGVTVGGKKYDVEIITEDDQSSPPGAISATNKLLQAGIKFIIAPIFPPNNIAISQICEEAKVIRVVPSQLDPNQFPPSQHYSFDANLTIYNAAPIYDYLKRNYPQVKTVVFLSPDDPGPIYARKNSAREAEKRGIKVLRDEVYATNTEDFYPLLTKLLALKPDAIDGIGGIPPWAQGIINQSRELGFKGPIFSGAPFGDPYLINSMLKPEYAHDVFEGVPDVRSDKMLPIVKTLRVFVEKAGFPYIFDSVNVLCALWPMLQGIEAAQSFDTDKVVYAMESMTSFETPWGKAKWAGQEINGGNHMAKMDKVALTRIMNGKFEFEWLER